MGGWVYIRVFLETLGAYVLDVVVCALVAGVEEKEAFGWVEILEVYEWEEGTGKVDVWVSMAFARVGRSVLDMLAAAILEVDM